MIRKFKITTSLVLLLVFIFPVIVKFEHHHDHFHCNAKNENHFHKLHEKCAICSFEFSVFSLDYNTFEIPKEQITEHYNEIYCKDEFQVNSNYAFLLRAPPVQIL